MSILTLDPSSTCVGWAHFCPTGGDAIDFGKLVVPQAWSANRRIAELADQVVKIAIDKAISVVVIEDCDGRKGRGVRAGGGAGIDIYGKAVGYIWAMLATAGPIRVEMIPVRTWTRGVAKGKRQMWVASKYGGSKGYRLHLDEGGDTSDALALGEWYFTEEKMKEYRAKAGAV